MVIMTLEPTPRTTTKRAKADAPPRERTETDDIVDRFIACARTAFPDTDAATLRELENQLRTEFGGGKGIYVRKPGRLDQLRSMYNGRNASECARQLGCSRATVYRLIKTQGRAA